MTKKQMWRTMWLRARYNYKAYLLFLILGFIFIVIFFGMLFTHNTGEMIEAQSIFGVAFVYIPVSFGQAIQPLEYSKCYYLIPRTMQERKQFTIFQNKWKMLLSIGFETILCLSAYLIQPTLFPYLLNWYLIAGFALTLMTGSTGYTCFYQKRHKSYRSYVIGNTLLIIICLTVLYGIMFFSNQKNIEYWNIVAVLSVAAMLIYHIICYMRFKNAVSEYENINKEEKRLCARVTNSVS